MIDRGQSTPTPLGYSTGHTPAARQGWSGVTADENRQKDTRTKEKKARGAGFVLAVQSLACAAILLVALLLRSAGGEAYQQLCQCFRESLLRNDLLAVLATLWDGDPTDGVVSMLEKENESAAGIAAAEESDSAESDTDGGRLPPAGTVAVPLRVNMAARPPVAAGSLTSGYGYRQNPTGDGEQFHRGIDIAAPAGTPIAAMFFGVVTKVAESGSLGRYVVLSHGDGVEVLYAHCAAVLAEEGTVMRAGETVARVGSTGDTTGSHVHIQVSANGIVYNPAEIVGEMRYA